jgi:hypothetical protein
LWHHNALVHKRATPEQVHPIGKNIYLRGWPGFVDGNKRSRGHDAIAQIAIDHHKNLVRGL